MATTKRTTRAKQATRSPRARKAASVEEDVVAAPVAAKTRRRPQVTPGVGVSTRRGELLDPAFSRGIHTAYVGNEGSGLDNAGNCKKHVSESFYRGRNDVVATSTLDQLRKEGICR